MRSISSFFGSVAKALLLIFSLNLAGILVAYGQDVTEGAALFKANCTSCHAIDLKVVGPALKGANDRHDEAWLLKWVKNSPAFIATGDAVAVKLFNDNNKIMMTPFPMLTEGNIKSILAYIKAEGDKPIVQAAAAPGGTTAPAANNGVNNFMLFGLIAVIIIALLVILVLNRVISTLENLLLHKPELITPIIEEEEVGKDPYAGVKRFIKNKKLVFMVVLLVLIVAGAVGTKVLWDTGIAQGYQPVQPILFSHQLHVGINKIDCQYCHSGAYKSKSASIPSLDVCMNCHNYVQATAKYAGKISPEILKIYTALDYNPDTKLYGSNQKPIQWIRIHNLQDFAYFNHSQHVKLGGIACQKCHGPVQNMAEVYQYSPLTMKWCINCHRVTEVNYKGNAYYDNLIAAHDKLKKGEIVTAAVLGSIECGKCHY